MITLEDHFYESIRQLIENARSKVWQTVNTTFVNIMNALRSQFECSGCPPCCGCHRILLRSRIRFRYN